MRSPRVPGVWLADQAPVLRCDGLSHLPSMGADTSDTLATTRPLRATLSATVPRIRANYFAVFGRVSGTRERMHGKMWPKKPTFPRDL